MNAPPVYMLRNLLLRQATPEDRAALKSYMKPRSASVGEVLAKRDCALNDLIFPETGMASAVIGGKVETEMIGREGAVGIPALLGVRNAPMDVICWMPIAGFSISVADFIKVANGSPTLGLIALRYVHAFMFQRATSALAANFTVDQRLARWLLMCFDRIESSEIKVSHEFLADRLNIRRPGVTVSLHVLEGERLIASSRCSIKVVDRERLRDFAGQAYGAAEVEYDRVMSEPMTTPTLRLAGA